MLDFGNIIDKNINHYVLTLFHHFKRKDLHGILDIVPAYSSLSFHYDVVTVRKTSANNQTAFEIIKSQIDKGLNEDLLQQTIQHRKISIPVCYSPAFAPDIEFIAYEKIFLSKK